MTRSTAGDPGGAHVHVWFLPRPLGMLEAQKMMLPLWEEVLPQVDQVVIDEARAAIAKALASDGG